MFSANFSMIFYYLIAHSPASELQNSSLLSAEFVQRRFNRIGNKDVTIRGDGHVVSLSKFSRTLAWLAGSSNGFAIVIQLQNLSGKPAHHIQLIVFCEMKTAGQALVGPLLDIAALVIKNLDSSILPIGNVDETMLIHHYGMGCVELTGAGPGASPFHQEIAPAIEFQHLRCAASVAYQEEYFAGPDDFLNPLALYTNVPNYTVLCGWGIFWKSSACRCKRGASNDAADE